ncbi:hypothetical protein PsorP6_007939 [Peronosclerospora sorghi]|uniref:Uncharacterized protein n=1 Tax=Peronosclerospora sorghi TaxID=230839 RepID=A0ACC0WDE5_9STRA|nr:hypothetical protein PsorP6_007939 [Peronosclerospora sorghi]
MSSDSSFKSSRIEWTTLKCPFTQSNGTFESAMFKPRPLIGAIQCFSSPQLAHPHIQSLVGTVARMPCLQCGLQTSLSLARSSNVGDVLNERVICRNTRLPLACSKECADEMEETKVDTLEAYKSLLEDAEYATMPEASYLFSKVLQSHRRESREWKGDQSITSWTEYFKLYRPENRWLNDARALRLLSSAYSYVMTLCRFLPELFDTKTRDNRVKNVALHVIGARAEALMPRYLWDELSFFYPRRQFDIKLIGDHVPIMPRRKKSATATTEDKEFIQLEMVNGLYHEIENLGTPDAFVMFNPGLGHATLRESWKPTLQTVLASRKPVLVTSFSPEDQQRDIAALQHIVNTSPELQHYELRFRCRAKKNSFRSLKYQVDPSNADTPIQANNRVVVVQLV